MKSNIKQFDLSNLSIKDNLILRAALNGLRSVLWPPVDLPAKDWDEIRAAARDEPNYDNGGF